jgi:hypothetical protein
LLLGSQRIGSREISREIVTEKDRRILPFVIPQIRPVQAIADEARELMAKISSDMRRVAEPLVLEGFQPS